jgi:hypothetical protein
LPRIWRGPALAALHGPRAIAAFAEITARLSPHPIFTRRRGHVVVEAFRAFPHNPAADETLERAQRRLVVRRDEADRVAHRERAAGAPDAMDVILRVHREVVVHDMRNAVDVDPRAAISVATSTRTAPDLKSFSARSR